jgi:hypothetical protein
MLVSGSTNSSCFVRPKGPLLRPDLSPGLTAAAGWGKDAEGDRRQPARSVLCVGHVRQFGDASPLCNLMEVKH